MVREKKEVMIDLCLRQVGEDPKGRVRDAKGMGEVLRGCVEGNGSERQFEGELNTEINEDMSNAIVRDARWSWAGSSAWW